MTALAQNKWLANKERALFVVSTVLLLAGGTAWLLAASTAADILWIAGTVLGLVFSMAWTVTAIRRRPAQRRRDRTARPGRCLVWSVSRSRGR